MSSVSLRLDTISTSSLLKDRRLTQRLISVFVNQNTQDVSFLGGVFMYLVFIACQVE